LYCNSGCEHGKKNIDSNFNDFLYENAMLASAAAALEYPGVHLKSLKDTPAASRGWIKGIQVACRLSCQS
jgi:hypothetical protein